MNARHRSSRLQLALLAYPRSARRERGEALVSLAEEMIDGGGSSTRREFLGMVRAGLTCRAGRLAEAPWTEALALACLPIAVAILALNAGVLIFWMEAIPAWPGWTWLALLAAPVLSCFGLLAGRRLPLAAGGLLICALGVLQGNGIIAAGHFPQADFFLDGIGVGFDMPLLGCLVPAGLLLMTASLTRLKARSRSVVLATIAWTIVGMIAVRLAYPTFLEIGGIYSNGLGLCALIYGVATLISVIVGFARRHQDPVAMLAGLLALTTTLPVALLYGVGFTPISEPLLPVLFAGSLLIAGFALTRAARLTAR